MEAREAELLPVQYFHVVFTLPAEIANIAYQNKRVIYDLLFKMSGETMQSIAADPDTHWKQVNLAALEGNRKVACSSDLARTRFPFVLRRPKSSMS